MIRSTTSLKKKRSKIRLLELDGEEVLEGVIKSKKRSDRGRSKSLGGSR